MKKTRIQKSSKLSLNKNQPTISTFFTKPKIEEHHGSPETYAASMQATDKDSNQKRKEREDSPEIIPLTPEEVKSKIKKLSFNRYKKDFENIFPLNGVTKKTNERETEAKKFLVESNKNVKHAFLKQEEDKQLEENGTPLKISCADSMVDIKTETLKPLELERLNENDSCKIVDLKLNSINYMIDIKTASLKPPELKIHENNENLQKFKDQSEHDMPCVAQEHTTHNFLKCPIIEQSHVVRNCASIVQEEDVEVTDRSDSPRNSMVVMKTFAQEHKTEDILVCPSTENKKVEHLRDEMNGVQNHKEQEVMNCNGIGLRKSAVSVQKEIVECSSSDKGKVVSSVVELEDETKCGNSRNELTSNCDNLLFGKWQADQLEDWNFEYMEENTVKFQLQLDVLKRCEVVDVKATNNGTPLLTLKCGDCRTTCLLKDFWSDIAIHIGDTVTVQAKQAPEGWPAYWVIDNLEGFLVQEPDTLVSSTSVVGSLFCARRGVLQEWFRGLSGDSPVMVIGCLVHIVLQEVLNRKLATETEATAVVKEVLSRSSSISLLYGANMTLEQGLKELMTFVPCVVEFVATYIHASRPASSESWHGSLCSIQDIEDNIWAPNLGIKGKVDVSVEVKIHNRKKMMPLELKTGRASFSAEHKGQVMLYTMMMSELGYSVNSGLLLYLRECVMQEIHTSHKEKRDLILLRNNLAHYLKQLPKLESDTFHAPPLPEPIVHQSACSKCPYLTLCCTYLSQDGLSQLSNTHPMKYLSEKATSHLKATHINYLIHWGGLIAMEAAAAENNVENKDLWCLLPSEREQRGRCLSNMVIKGEVEPSDEGMFVHNLQKEIPSCVDLRCSSFTKGDFVVVSTDVRPAVTTGTVLCVNECNLQLLLNKNLKKGSSSKLQHFHVDFYAYDGGKTFNLTNLGYLLENTPVTERLRRLIIDKDQPCFEEKLPSSVLQVGRKILRPLNVAQRKAVIKVLTAKDYLLIKGMPGTGKTQTIVAMVELLVKLGHTVLISSHTHSAVDNVLLKLVARGVDFLRLGSTKRIHLALHSKGEEALAVGCTDPVHLTKLYNSKAVVATTCLGSGHILLSKRTFDICIVDESTQVLQVSVLRPLFCATKFVLIGDPNQLPPVVRSKTARDLGMSESLFAKLDGKATVSLDLQYRMNEAITDLANRFTYEGHLKCGNTDVANSVLHLPNLQELEKDFSEEQWLQVIMSSDMKHSVLFLDTGCQTHVASNLTNVHEAALIFHIIQKLLKGGLSEKYIGVIAPYRAQVALLTKIMCVEVNTVDQYQGRDKSVIIFSCTRSGRTISDKDKEAEILSDHQRLTVAITRAKQKLLIVGDQVALEKYNTFKKLFSCLAEEQVFNLSNGSDGFFWKQLMDPIKEHIKE